NSCVAEVFRHPSFQFIDGRRGKTGTSIVMAPGQTVLTGAYCHVLLRCQRLVSPMSSLPNLYLFGVPGKIGGAATKIAHLIKLLHRIFRITVVVPSIALCKD